MFEKMRDMSSECGREWDQYVCVIVWVCDYVGAYSFTIFLFSIEGFGFKRLPLYMYTTRLWQNERSWYLRTHSFLISFFIFFLSFSQSLFDSSSHFFITMSHDSSFTFLRFRLLGNFLSFFFPVFFYPLLFFYSSISVYRRSSCSTI